MSLELAMQFSAFPPLIRYSKEYPIKKLLTCTQWGSTAESSIPVLRRQEAVAVIRSGVQSTLLSAPLLNSGVTWNWANHMPEYSVLPVKPCQKLCIEKAMFSNETSLPQCNTACYSFYRKCCLQTERWTLLGVFAIKYGHPLQFCISTSSVVWIPPALLITSYPWELKTSPFQTLFWQVPRQRT